MSWKKLGIVYRPQQDENGNTHTQVPTAFVIDNKIRVYYAARNKFGKSFTTFVELDRKDPRILLYQHFDPVLVESNPGTFDDEGNMPSDIILDQGRIYLYYSGWNQRKTIPYHNATGLAVSDDGGTSFKRVYEGPILDRTFAEPYLAVTPCVLRQDREWKMWYVSGLRWIDVQDKYEPVYVIKYAESNDGHSWQRKPNICIPQKHKDEAFSRPYVISEKGIYKMWYCYRDSVDYRDGLGSYQIGYAESVDGEQWQRLDHKAGINRSSDKRDWDSSMLCYPNILVDGNNMWLFYNGNSFGRSGFGVASWED